MKFYKLSNYLRDRSKEDRARVRLFCSEYYSAEVDEGEKEPRLSSRDWIFNCFTLAAAASGRAEMNGFTWSAKGDLVPVCCHNAVGNTSPCSAKARRSLYYSTRRHEAAPGERASKREREKERERSLNYLVGSTRRFCLSYRTTTIS